VLKTKVTLNVPLNRVEGDLEIRVEVDGDRVIDAWSSGTMYRGIENILHGRQATDGLVITPRVCGICGTAHLYAAVKALEAVNGVRPLPDAVRLRNLTLLAEHLQSDVRQAFLMFTADFVNPAYKDLQGYAEAVRRYTPLAGETVLEVIRETRKIVEIVAILGGQWPHSAFMVPGGVVTVPSQDDLLACENLLQRYRRWYEQRVLGCSVERFLEVQSAAALDAFLEENSSQRESDLGFFAAFARRIGLDRIGGGYGRFITFGQLDLPAEPGESGEAAIESGGGGFHYPAGFADGLDVQPLLQAKITEDVSHSWFEDDAEARHPFEGRTEPYATGGESRKYSWAKAPRYNGLPAETGPLAEMVVFGNRLITDLIRRDGVSAYLREFARVIRPAYLIPVMEQWLEETNPCEKFYLPPEPIESGRGFGMVGASRGALGHWITVDGGRIERYQIITPTAWNGSPRDREGVRGPWEEALIGTTVKDVENPVELGHVVRSFDPCLVCTVHALHGPSRKVTRTRV